MMSIRIQDLNKIFIEGTIVEVIDSKALIYVLQEKESGILWRLNSTKKLDWGYLVEVIGRVDFEVEYYERSDLLIESSRFLVVDCSEVIILDIPKKYDDYELGSIKF